MRPRSDIRAMLKPKHVSREKIAAAQFPAEEIADARSGEAILEMIELAALEHEGIGKHRPERRRLDLEATRRQAAGARIVPVRVKALKGRVHPRETLNHHLRSSLRPNSDQDARSSLCDSSARARAGAIKHVGGARARATVR